MTDDPDHTPPDDRGPDPAEAELVAYLDGELDESASAEVTRRLATDPALRARAAELKKSFDLLDFLPRHDPSPTFATRTVEKLPAVKAGVDTRPAAPAATSSSVPIVIESGTGYSAPAGGGWVWAVGVAVAVGLALLGGYLGTAAARTYLQPPAKDHATAAPTPTAATDDDPPPDRVIELLPLYFAADSLEFARELAADPDLFGDEAAGPGGVPGSPRLPWAGDLPALAKAFRALPPDRQKQIRLLDQQLHKLDATERVPLLRALEAYAVWLSRLKDEERASVLAAAPKDRLAVVTELRRQEWAATMPAALQKQIQGLPAAERAGVMGKWRDDEADRRKAWALPGPTREAARQGRVPWPFDADDLRRQVVDYARAVYRLDEKDPRRWRLTPTEQLWLVEAFDRGREENDWLWFGKLLYDLSWRYEVLPEPDGRPPVTDVPQLWDAARQHFAKPMARQKVQKFVGKWPEFALATHEELTLTKLHPPADFSFGPARPEEFREPTRHFVHRELLPALRPAERLALKAADGKWPEYPRLMTQLARLHDLGVPGVTLPGKPSQWERTYGGTGRPPFRPRP